MQEPRAHNRRELVRESLMFQLKLMADGFRDVLLLPVSLAATAIGLLRGGTEPDREFRRVIELGRRSEQWINLFGAHAPLEEAGHAGSIDRILDRAEQVLRDQVRQGGISESASQAIQRALDAVHHKAQDGRGGGPPGAAQ